MASAWHHHALAALERSLFPVPSERNDLDWKSALSENGDKLSQHLSAFSNLEGGGFMAFGISNEGEPAPLSREDMEQVVQRLGQIARTGVEPPVELDHTIMEHRGAPVLFIKIPEHSARPVHLRGKGVEYSYIRSAGQTVKMSRQEIARAIQTSSGDRFEERPVLYDLKDDDVLDLLDHDSYFRLQGTRQPEARKAVLQALEQDNVVLRGSNGWTITNLGALLFARDIARFEPLKRKMVRLVVYNGVKRSRTESKEIIGTRGYASGFAGLVKYVHDLLPPNEVVRSALREERKLYPEVAIREFVANALIHQDLELTGNSVMIEVFTDRIEITNPGRPLVDPERFIDSAPRSRNEAMASLMRRMRICEERGSGVDLAIEAIEEHQLPAPKFQREDDHMRVTLYAPTPTGRMRKEDRIRAIYQHACLLYVNNQEMTNASLRKRFNIAEKNHPMASRYITEAMEAGAIVPSDPENVSKRNASYIPSWAR